MAEELRPWLLANQIAILNVAGNWETKLSTEQMEIYRSALTEA